ncbi:MAG: hypothetical protein IPF53_21830 [Blastocatellia bacterium]|nr:hypothetical protein [Blastocatellia bacterium]
MDAGATSATPTLDARIRTASIVVLAIAMSVVMFAVVATMMATGESPGPAAGMLLVPLVVAALAALVASVMIRRVSFKPARILSVHANGGEKGLAELMFRITIISSVLGEAVGIFGLILGIVAADMYYAYVLCGIALMAVLSNYPRARQWRELSTEITQRARSGSTSGSFGHGLQ